MRRQFLARQIECDGRSRNVEGKHRRVKLDSSHNESDCPLYNFKARDLFNSTIPIACFFLRKSRNVPTDCGHLNSLIL